LPSRIRKIRRQRGSRSMGWGQVGQHRKTGMKGGSGITGRLKHKWSWTVKYGKDHYGTKGFTPPTSISIKKWTNVGKLDEIFRQLSGKITHSKQKAEINLDKLGYEKLLGNGIVKGAYIINVNSFTKSAKEKIEKTGGEITEG